MKAMVLAAGQGTRLKPFTDAMPKPMMPVAGKPLLEHIIRQLKESGITEIVINLHHQPESIQRHFGDGTRFGVRIIYSHEDKLLGTAGAVKNLESHFMDTFLVYYGDNYVEIDLNDLVQKHKVSQAAATIAVFPCETPHLSGIVQIDGKGNILNFVEKPPKGSAAGNLANAGIYVMEPRILAFIPAGRSSDFGKDIFPEILRQKQVLRSYLLKGNVIGIDTPELHAKLEAYLSNK